MFSSMVRFMVMIRIRFSVWLVSGYEQVFILRSVVIVTHPVKCEVYSKEQQCCA